MIECLLAFSAVAVVTACAAFMVVGGFPMARLERAMRNDGRWSWAWLDRRGRAWVADGRWDVCRCKAEFEMQGYWVEKEKVDR
ncbi:MAG: hypothetical protein EOR63_32275 [Mesorhizobium sp.]|nr:MAG: hypothetical protein EOR63_32275 [Mesorhizobium sp.]